MLWDPAPNYWHEESDAPPTALLRSSPYHFNREQIWKGLWRTPKDGAAAAASAPAKPKRAKKQSSGSGQGDWTALPQSDLFG